jgi:multidrug efflux pump subunit AcrA (membrane-fusion protein)
MSTTERDIADEVDGSQDFAAAHPAVRSPGTRLWSSIRDRPFLTALLVAAVAVMAVLALEALGSSSEATVQVTRTAVAGRGVVQSTVSGSGTITSAGQYDLGFKASGTVTSVDVKQGQHVVRGQLIASIDPRSSEVALEQAKATLKSAEAGLAALEENDGESTSGQTSSASGASASTAAVKQAARAHVASGSQGAEGEGHTSTTPTTTTGGKGQGGGSTKKGSRSKGTSKSPASSSGSKSSNSESTSSTQTESKKTTTTQSAATREANLAAARASVHNDELAVRAAQEALANTKLLAPETGTVVTLTGSVGETVSATGSSRASTSSSSSSTSTGSGASSTSAAAGASSTGSSSSGAGGSSSSSFAVISNLEELQMVVAVSESEINSVHVGQIATVTVEALEGKKVAAHVAQVSELPASSSSAVSYDVTFALDQVPADVRIGMSASASVVVKQAEGVNVASSAIKGDAVTVLRGGSQVSVPVTTGLVGDSTTIVASGLKAGETVVLPTTAASRSTSGTSSRRSSFFGSGLSRSGASGGGFAGAGGGGFAAGGGGPP